MPTTDPQRATNAALWKGIRTGFGWASLITSPVVVWVAYILSAPRLLIAAGIYLVLGVAIVRQERRTR